MRWSFAWGVVVAACGGGPVGGAFGGGPVTIDSRGALRATARSRVGAHAGYRRGTDCRLPDCLTGAARAFGGARAGWRAKPAGGRSAASTD